MVRYVVLEGEHNCINHATGGDDCDLSVEELRFLCQKYYDEYDAVRVILPNGQDKAFSYTTPVIQPNCPPPPSRHKRLLGRIVKEIVLSSSKPSTYKSYYTTAENHHHHVIDIDDNDNDDDDVVGAPYYDHDNNNVGEEDMVLEYDHNAVDKDDHDESSVVASSVASNDYVPEDVNMDEEESVESQITIAKQIISL